MHHHLRRALVALALVCAVAARLDAQASDPPAVDDLKAPPSPAFVLLGVAPSRIDRPQAVRPLVLSALSAVSSEGFPRNYAVEFAPYWLGTPQLSFDDYYKSSVGQALARHLSLSVATTPLGSSPDAGTALAVGARTLPLPGHAHPLLAALRAKLHDLQLESIKEEGFLGRRQRLVQLLQEAQGSAAASTTAELSTKPFEDLIDKMIDLDIEIQKQEIRLGTASATDKPAVQAALAAARQQRRDLAAEMLRAVEQSDIGKNIATEKQFEVLVTRYDQAQQARAAKRESALRATALAIQDLDTQRVGPLLAVAAALAWDVPAGNTSLTSLAKVGLWATPGYRIVRCAGDGVDQSCSTSVDLLGVVRYLDNRRSIDNENVWEIGARGIWQARTKLALSAEWLGRTGDDDPGSRIVGVAEYAVTDSVYLYASFGRDFEERGVRKNLVSTIGLTFGLGKRPILN